MNTRKHTHTMHFATIPRKIRKYACTGRTYGVGVKARQTQLHNSKYMYSYDSSQKKRDGKRSHTRVMLTHPRPPNSRTIISIVESKLYQKKNLKTVFQFFFCRVDISTFRRAFEARVGWHCELVGISNLLCIVYYILLRR